MKQFVKYLIPLNILFLQGCLDDQQGIIEDQTDDEQSTSTQTLTDSQTDTNQTTQTETSTDAQTDSQTNTQTQIDLPTPLATVESIYEIQCASCHGESGQGIYAPPLLNLHDYDALLTDIARMPNEYGPDCQGLDNCQSLLADYIFNTFVTVVDETGNPFACEQLSGSQNNVRRLGMQQLHNAFIDFIKTATPLSEQEHLIDDTLNRLEDLPTDGHVSGFENLDDRISDYHIERFLDVATRLANRLANNYTVLNSWTNEQCSYENNGCMATILDHVGGLILRKTLSVEDRDFYLSSDNREQMLGRLFLSPDFIFQNEIYGEEIEAGVLNLTANELANRLALFFWNSAPDIDLLATVESGLILEDYESVVNQVFYDERTQTNLAQFYGQWMRIDDIPNLNDYDPGESEFRATDYGTTGNTALLEDFNSREFVDQAAQEILDLGYYYTFATSGQFEDLFLSNLSFATDELANVYGVSSWDGNFENPVLLPQTDRAGLLTRAGLHIYGNKNSRPILKGTRILEDILCEHIPLPEDNSQPEATMVTDTMSVREKTIEITQQPGTACESCHLERINPLGFALEDYDGYGRFRDTELIYHPWGALAAQPNADASATVRVDNEFVMVNGGVQLSQVIGQSDQAAACFSRQVFRFSMNRMEDLTQDSCMLREIYQSTKNASLAEVFRQIALQPEFKVRRLDADQGAQ